MTLLPPDRDSCRPELDTLLTGALAPPGAAVVRVESPSETAPEDEASTQLVQTPADRFALSCRATVCLGGLRSGNPPVTSQARSTGCAPAGDGGGQARPAECSEGAWRPKWLCAYSPPIRQPSVS